MIALANRGIILWLFDFRFLEMKQKCTNNYENFANFFSGSTNLNWMWNRVLLNWYGKKKVKYWWSTISSIATKVVCFCLSNPSVISVLEWWMLFQKHVVHTKLYIYVIIGNSSLLHQSSRNCQSCQISPATFGKMLIRTDTRLVFCNRKLMRTDIILTRTTKPICNFVNSVTYL